MLKTIAAAILLTFAFAGAAYAQTCTGKTGAGTFKVTFLGGQRLRFCYGRRCSNGTFSGSRNGRLAFGNRAFRFNMTKSGRGYRYSVNFKQGVVGGRMTCR